MFFSAIPPKEQDEGQSIDRQIADIFSIEDLGLLLSFMYQVHVTKGKITLLVSETIVTERLGTVTLQACAFMKYLVIVQRIWWQRPDCFLLMDLKFHTIQIY